MVDRTNYIPTIFRTEDTDSAYSRIIMDFELAPSTVSDTNSFYVTHQFQNVTASGVEEFLVEAQLNVLRDPITMYFETEFQTNTVLNKFTDLPDDFYISTPAIKHWHNFGVAYSYGYLGPLYGNNIHTELKLYIGTLAVVADTDVELYIANDKYFYLDFSMYCTSSGLTGTYLCDVNTGSGKITMLRLDLFNTASGITDIPCDCYSSILVSGTDFDVDMELASGAVIPVIIDTYSTASGVSGVIPCDIRTWSLGVSDFFLDPGEHTTASSIAWVDIYDPSYDIVPSGCYFKVDGVQVSGTISGSGNSYRMYYNPGNDFYTDGITVYTAHVENIMGDFLNQNYNLRYGYDLSYKGADDWGPHKKVNIWSSATNKVSCPNTATDAFYFITRDLEGRNLPSSITAVVYEDFGVEIYPQSTSFFYGSEFRVTISGVKDFAGNEMEPFIYDFKIEDPIT